MLKTYPNVHYTKQEQIHYSDNSVSLSCEVGRRWLESSEGVQLLQSFSSALRAWLSKGWSESSVSPWAPLWLQIFMWFIRFFCTPKLFPQSLHTKARSHECTDATWRFKSVRSRKDFRQNEHSSFLRLKWTVFSWRSAFDFNVKLAGHLEHWYRKASTGSMWKLVVCGIIWLETLWGRIDNACWYSCSVWFSRLLNLMLQNLQANSSSGCWPVVGNGLLPIAEPSSAMKLVPISASSPVEKSAALRASSPEGRKYG